MKSDPYYQSKKHKAWRAKVLRRDNYQCQECKRYGILREGTIAHHVKPREDYPELQYDVANGRTLCAKHHNKEHPEKGTKALKSRRQL
ncbi:HNH endonuclease [Acetobacterium wieringae]|uniref:HNH endonuclease n=1 Tax=Acetobacterium wieringae TaxID=52694 RepID=UPI0031596A42